MAIIMQKLFMCVNVRKTSIVSLIWCAYMCVSELKRR